METSIINYTTTSSQFDLLGDGYNKRKVPFKNLSIKKVDKIIPHLAKENLHNSNLISDIKDLDYTKGAEGKMFLKPLTGLKSFYDDAYAVGYVTEDQVDFIGKDKYGRIQLKQGENAAASILIRKFKLISDEVFVEDARLIGSQKIAFIVNIHSTDSKILDLLKIVEERSNKRILKAFKKYRVGPYIDIEDVADTENFKDKKRIVGVAYIKINISNLPIENFLTKLRRYEIELNKIGFGLLSVDYARDHAGTLNVEELTQYLKSIGFIDEEDLRNPDSKNRFLMDDFFGRPVLLDVKEKAGNNTLRYRKRIDDKLFVEVKVYNKYCSNLEAGNVQLREGSHICELVSSYDEHLIKTFHHPDSLENGLSRLEISVYGFNTGVNYAHYIEEEFKLLTKEQLFYKQPLSKQWSNLTELVKSNCVFANRSNNDIWVVHYG